MLRLWTIILLFLAGLGSAWAQGEPQRAIEHVAGNLYRFQNNFHFGVFLVGDEGVLLVDPINEGTAKWVKGEIKSRFGKDVTLVAYSHNHADHTSGGQVFAETAEFLAQEKAVARIAESGHTTTPTISFKWRHEVEFAGEVVEFIYPGPTHTDDLFVVHFPAEKALFIVDMATVRRLPYRDFPGFQFPEGISNLRSVEKLDFEIFVGGHGPIGTKADLSDHIRYLDALYMAVSHASKEGLSLDEIKAKVTMEPYKDWGQYEAWLGLNIEGLYRHFNPPGQ
jgi:glyoxylase-like metal-dependent hydrolase (beta-lactamase superfamily II)